MEPTLTPRFKICCIQSAAEAQLAVAAGASAVGLVSEMPSGPGVLGEAEIAAIAPTVPPPVATFLLTAHTRAQAIAEQLRRCGCNTVQLVDLLAYEERVALKLALPAVKVVQVVHVTSERSVDEALAAARGSDALLLDSGDPSAKVRELGGTGRVHNWAISREIRARAAIPVFLAGGLTPDNAQAAIREVGPFGLDVCSGLRTDGQLDPAKLRRFAQALATRR